MVPHPFAPSAPPPPTTPLGLRVLVAEDNPTNQVFIMTLLQNFGCQADLAVNGREAVARHRERPYDVILMDCRMPLMDGFTATAEIRRHEQSLSPAAPRTPIIALTAEALSDQREQCRQSGMDDHLTKPLRAATLRQYLERFRPGKPDHRA